MQVRRSEFPTRDSELLNNKKKRSRSFTLLIIISPVTKVCPDEPLNESFDISLESLNITANTG